MDVRVMETYIGAYNANGVSAGRYLRYVGGQVDHWQLFGLVGYFQASGVLVDG